jgi:hypothetical protein
VSRWPQSSLVDISTLNTEAIRSSKMSVDTRTTRCHIAENGILHSHHLENLKSYVCFCVVPLPGFSVDLFNLQNHKTYFECIEHEMCSSFFLTTFV